MKLWFIEVFGCVVSGLRCAWFGMGSGLYVSTEIAYWGVWVVVFHVFVYLRVWVRF